MSAPRPTVFDRAATDDIIARTMARRAASDDLEVAFTGREVATMRLAESRVVQAGRATVGRVTVRAVRAGGLGISTTTDLSDDGLAACVREAEAQAATASPHAEGDAASLSAPGPSREAPSWALDADTAWLDGETKARWLATALEAHEKDGLALAGRFHTGLGTRAVRSTAGVDAFHQGSYADLALSALERPAGHRASAYRATYTARVDAGVIATMAEEVRATCHRAHDPRPVPLGAWDVVLMPAAVADLLLWLAEIGFGSRAVEDGTSFLAERFGQRVTGERVTLVDDGLMPYGVGVPSPFDAEGQPRQRVSLIEGGVGRSGVHDSRSARRAGCAGTGHASDPAQLAADGARANHVHFLPGSAGVDELVGQLDRGLLISRFHYVNGMLEPRRAVMTGLLRDAAFLVEGGRQRHAVETMRFTDSILEAFARIPAGGVGRDLEPHTTFDGECFVCPPLLIRGLQFTSGR